MSNAASIFAAARARIATVLGATYREHTQLFSTEELDTKSLENGYGLLLLDSQEKSPQVNGIFIERKVRVIITHRTYASGVGPGKVVAKLETVYDREAEIIASFREWNDPTIGLIKFLPTSESSIETHETDEDSFLVNTINFDILYKN